jgi:hypothetical protein
MKPQVIVERYPSEKEWTLSEYFIEGVKYGVGVEDQEQHIKVHGETRIDNGIYELGLRDSPKFSNSYYVDSDGNLSPTKNERFNKPHQLIWVMGVDNFLYVLWHWGNSDLDTDACFIVGSYFGDIEVTVKGKKEIRRGVVSSRINYVKMYPIIYKLIKANEAKGLKTYVEYKNKAA